MSTHLLAKDLMRKHVLTLKPQMTLREAAKTLSDHQITGAPVLCEGGKILGVLSQSDLVRQERKHTPDAAPSYHREQDEAFLSCSLHTEELDRLRVDQVMTPWAISFEEDTPVPELARQMLSKRIHRVLITRDGELCGIVTTMDILRAYLIGEQPPAHGRS